MSSNTSNPGHKPDGDSPQPKAAPENQTKFWNDPKKRSLLFQVLLLSVLGFFFYTVVSNTLNNLEQRGITTGFEVLNFHPVLDKFPDAGNTLAGTLAQEQHVICWIKWYVHVQCWSYGDFKLLQS